MFGGVHLLPFFNPIDGKDAGFDPIDHTEVDRRLGTWSDIATIGTTHYIMADLIVNHVSAQSLVFQDVLANGSQSPYFDLIMTKEKIFGSEATQLDIDKIYRPRPTPCFTPMTCATGEVMNVWTTFTSNQIDIDVTGEQGQAYLDLILDTFDFINALSAKANSRGMNCLVEIHSY